MKKYSESILYDKADYHYESIESYGLPESHMSHHTLYFLRWLIENNLMSDLFNSEPRLIQEYRSGERSLLSIYEWWDCCFTDDMLSEEGNAFTQHYFDLNKGKYIMDYIDFLQGSLESEFHIEFNERNYEVLKQVIDKRYHKWKKRKWWWPF